MLLAAAVYAGAGAVFAVAFVLTGAARLDEAARGATWGFRLVIVPGAVALWPWLAWRWARGGVREEHNPHRDCAAKAGVSPP
jgi:hypothetical protein